MHTHRQLLLTVVTLTCIISALPVKADHHKQVTTNLEFKHNSKITAEDKDLCAHEQSNQKIVSSLPMVGLSTAQSSVSQ